MATPEIISHDNEKRADYGTRSSSQDEAEHGVGKMDTFEDHEVFKRGANVEFRTVGWVRVSDWCIAESRPPNIC